MDIDATADSILELTECLDRILHQAKRDLQDASTEDFVDSKVSKLFGIVKAYNDCFTRLKVKTRDEMHRSLQKKFRHREIQERVEHLEEVEREWDTFLKDIDSSLYQEESAALSTGQTAPLTNVLMDGRTGETTSLQNYLALSEAGGRVIVLSFGTPTGAQRWLKDTQCTFDMLLDENREIYKAFGLRRSVFKVWCVSALVYYAEQMAAGVPPITPYENIEDDPHQMGGDFILDKEGTLKLMYCSKTSSDRPSVKLIIATLKPFEEMKPHLASLATNKDNTGLSQDEKHDVATNQLLETLSSDITKAGQDAYKQ